MEGLTGGQWRMHAEHADTEYRHLGDPRYVRHYGHDPVPVDVTEHPDGAYYGWIRAGSGSPEMVWRGWARFVIQFTYGPRAEQDAGKGRIVRLAIEPAKET